MADTSVDKTAKKSKLVTDRDVTMSGCLHAIKKLRNCAICPLRNDREACKKKKCVPKVVLDRIELAIREHFYQQKYLAMLASSKDPATESASDAVAGSFVDKLRI